MCNTRATEALQARRSYALTGDRIDLLFSVNGYPMGSLMPSDTSREITAQISAGGVIDYVDVIKMLQLLQNSQQLSEFVP